jgi:drug/metabolite transporter (DMT)-like permease
MASGSTIAGTLWILPLALAERPWTVDASAGSLVALVWLGLFPTALATILYFHLIRKLGATTFSQVNYLVPVLGTLWGITLLGERPGWPALVALAMVVTGVAFVSRAGTRPDGLSDR